jgi:hypothetical protein
MASSLGRRRGTWGRSGIGELCMEEDGRTARPRDFPRRESHRVSRSAFKKLIDMPAMTKMAVLLAKNKEMKIHTAAHIAARYTTGACANSIVRRLVKHFPVAASEIMNMGGNDGRKFVDDDISLSDKDNIILINLLNLIDDHIEENFLPLLALSRVTFEILFNNSERLLSESSWFCSALVILGLVRPVFYRETIFTVA